MDVHISIIIVIVIVWLGFILFTLLYISGWNNKITVVGKITRVIYENDC